jgi:hypothetical protein
VMLATMVGTATLACAVPTWRVMRGRTAEPLR